MNNCYNCLFKENHKDCRQCNKNVRTGSGTIIKSYLVQDVAAGENVEQTTNDKLEYCQQRVAELEYLLWYKEEEIRKLKNMIGEM